MPKMENNKDQGNHESTKFGKHEKGPVFLYNPFFLRVFPLSPFRDKGLLEAFSTSNSKEPGQNLSPRKHEIGKPPQLNSPAVSGNSTGQAKKGKGV